MKKLLLVSAILIIVLLCSNPTYSDTESLKKVTFLPHWIPQAQFVGFYVALHQGIYKKHGLDVTVVIGGPDHPGIEYLKKRKVDFITMFLSAAIQERAKGTKLVNICQLSQRSAQMLVAKKSSGIEKPEDLYGKKVGLWRAEFQLLPRAFFKKFNLIVCPYQQQNTVNLFLWDGIDVVSAMLYNEYHVILNCGLNPDELTVFSFHEYEDLNFPEDGIYCLERTYRNDPETCRSFVKATIEGWIYAFTYRNEALDIMIEYMTEAHYQANEAHQRWMLARMKDLIMPSDPDVHIGHFDRGVYLRGAAMLKEAGFIDAIPRFEDFHLELYNDEE